MINLYFKIQMGHLIFQSFLILGQFFMFFNDTDPGVIKPYFIFNPYSLGKNALLLVNATCYNNKKATLTVQSKGANLPLQCLNIPPLSHIPSNKTAVCNFIVKNSPMYSFIFNECNKGEINGVFKQYLQ